MKKIIFLIFASLAVLGCKKKQDTIAKVYVYDWNNNPVIGCTVVLKGESSESTVTKKITVGDTLRTNSQGEAIFNLNEVYQLGQAGVAVLNVYASQQTTGAKATGIIQVEAEKTTSVNVVLK
jgi:hypothetical protein